MGHTDWMLSDIGSPSIIHGATTGIAGPSGATWVYGFHSTATVAGGRFLVSPEFVAGPAILETDGVSVRGAMRRGPCLIYRNFAPMLMVGSAVDRYALGLADAEPAHIVLARRTADGNLIDAEPGVSGVLRRSTATYAMGEWVHLRLDARLNAVGPPVGPDRMLLECYASDLTANSVDAAPDWQPIPGMTAYLDAVPYLPLRCPGFGVWTADIDVVATFAHVEVHRQIW